MRAATLALFLLVGPIGIAIGLIDELPARVGCACAASDVGSDWVRYGTSTSAPLLVLAAIAFGAILSLRSGWMRIVGIVVLVLAASAAFGGILGESFVPAEADTPHFLLAVLRVLSFAAAGAVFLLGLWDLSQGLRSPKTAEEAQS
jgi:hypothetical protein